MSDNLRHLYDDGCLNVFLAAAILHVVRDAVPVQAPACASVVSSTAILGFDAGFSGGLDVGGHGVGRFGENAAACRVVVDFGTAAARSSAGGTTVCQVMSPGSSGVVLGSFVEYATASSNCTVMFLSVPTPLHFRPPAPVGNWGAS